MAATGLKLVAGFAVSIFLGAFFYYAFLYLPYHAISTVGPQLIENAGTNSTVSDSVILFFDNLVSYGIVIFLIALVYYVWVMSQRRGVPVYE